MIDLSRLYHVLPSDVEHSRITSDPAGLVGARNVVTWCPCVVKATAKRLVNIAWLLLMPKLYRSTSRPFAVIVKHSKISKAPRSNLPV
ncbi:hypothetical protein M514_07685 [Trichuris suis]|uniref:Uncharacterized protein n=1 Tax=Trichuris suis TaxID=68888 RepID=A0A085MXI8_9BILA|nr:hypothetical protein M514_07685 [Trichuris suis]